MGNYERLKPGGDLECVGGTSCLLEDILALRLRFPTGYGLSIESQGVLAWEYGDDEAARIAFAAADELARLREKSSEASL